MTDNCTTDACNVLLVFPGFNANSFWNYQATCEIVGAKYPGAPLGLITVAAMLPRHWSIKLVNRNTEELDEADLEWADMVMTGGMMPQQWDTLALIELAHAHGKVVVVGGPGIHLDAGAVSRRRFQGAGRGRRADGPVCRRLARRRTRRHL